MQVSGHSDNYVAGNLVFDEINHDEFDVKLTKQENFISNSILHEININKEYCILLLNCKEYILCRDKINIVGILILWHKMLLKQNPHLMICKIIVIGTKIRSKYENEKWPKSAQLVDNLKKMKQYVMVHVMLLVWLMMQLQDCYI